LVAADEMTAKQLVQVAAEVQTESKQSTARTQQVLQHTIDLGQTTAATLKNQTEQLQNVDTQLDTLESNLRRADKQIRIFLRRMATDRVVMGLVALVILGVIGAIVAAVVRARQNGTTVSVQIRLLYSWGYRCKDRVMYLGSLILLL
jgi:SNARE protein